MQMGWYQIAYSCTVEIEHRIIYDARQFTLYTPEIT